MGHLNDITWRNSQLSRLLSLERKDNYTQFELFLCQIQRIQTQWKYSLSPQWAKSPKNSLKECVYIRCQIVKNTLLQIAFSAICPLGSNFCVSKTKSGVMHMFSTIIHVHVKSEKVKRNSLFTMSNLRAPLHDIESYLNRKPPFNQLLSYFLQKAPLLKSRFWNERRPLISTAPNAALIRKSRKSLFSLKFNCSIVFIVFSLTTNSSTDSLWKKRKF